MILGIFIGITLVLGTSWGVHYYALRTGKPSDYIESWCETANDLKESARKNN